MLLQNNADKKCYGHAAINLRVPEHPEIEAIRQGHFLSEFFSDFSDIVAGTR